MRPLIAWLLVSIALVAAEAAAADAPIEPRRDPPLPWVEITTDVEDGEKIILGTVTLSGKPMAGVKVSFFARRTFGLLPLGEEETLEDGTAAVPFPKRLPGGSGGDLDVVARITAPEEYRSVENTGKVAGGTVVRREADPFPRALWAPRAPLSLVLTISLLLGAVWCVYGYVFVQLRAIRKGGDV